MLYNLIKGGMHMPFFDNLGKKVGEAAQAAAKKSNELVEVTKLNMSVNSEEDKASKLYEGIGKKLYANYKAGAESLPDFSGEFEQINACEENIKEIRKRIMNLKNVKLCQNCGAELAEKAMFCPKCGAKQEVIPPAPVQEDKAPQAAPSFCPECGTEMPADTTFCSNCGAQIQK